MNSVAHADLLTPASPTAPRRSRFVTLFSWCLIIGAALLVPVSTVTLMMLLVGSDGTANATWSGALLVVGGPPATVLAGVGLLRRHRWAYVFVLVLLTSVLVRNIVILQRGPTPERTSISPTGLRTTTLASEVNRPLHLTAIVVCLALLAKLLVRSTRSEFNLRPATRAASPIRLQRPKPLTPPAAAAPITVQADRLPRAQARALAATPQQMRALWIAISVILALSAGTAYLALTGVKHGRTYLPVKRASLQRVVQQGHDPALFWFSVGLYGAISLGALGLAGWGVREAHRLKRAK